LASIAAAKAYFFSRRTHQTSLFEARVGPLSPVDLLRVLQTAKSHLIEKPSFLGATERVAARLVAARRPEAVVNERRRRARKNAKKKGYTPSQAHLALLAWNLFITNVPCAVWVTETVLKVYPIRWPIEVYQSQPIKMTWRPLRVLAATIIYLRGRVKREHIIDVDLLPRDDDLLDQALGDDLAFCKREALEVLAP